VALSIFTDLSLALSPNEVFFRCVGGKADPWQSRVMEGFIAGSWRKAAWITGRQQGKSSLASVIILLQSLYVTPGGNSVLLAPSQRQSAALMAMVSKFYRALTGGEGRTAADDLEAESKLSMTLANGSTIRAYPGNNDGKTVRGATAELCVVDEFCRCSLDLMNAVRPMVSTKRADGKAGRLILLSTPGFASGWGHGLFMKDDPSWSKERVTALDNPRIDPIWLENERKEIGESAYQSEYMAAFTDPGASIFGSAILEAAMSDNISVIRW
jgi:hypothetical protein